MLFILASVLSAAFAECVPARLEDLDNYISEAEEAYSQQDRDLFNKKVLGLIGTLDCFEAIVTRPRAIKVHALVGLWSVGRQEPTYARLSFMAVKRLDPKFEFPDWMVGASDPGRIAYKKSFTPKIEVEELKKPVNGTLRFDGENTLNRPISTPTIFQRVDSAGRPRKGAYLWPGQEVPEYNTKFKGPKRRPPKWLKQPG